MKYFYIILKVVLLVDDIFEYTIVQRNIGAYFILTDQTNREIKSIIFFHYFVIISLFSLI